MPSYALSTEAKGATPDTCFTENKKATDALGTVVKQKEKSLASFVEQNNEQTAALSANVADFATMFMADKQQNLDNVKIIEKNGLANAHDVEQATEALVSAKDMSAKVLDSPPGIATTKRRKTISFEDTNRKSIGAVPFAAAREVWDTAQGNCNSVCIPRYIAAEEQRIQHGMRNARVE